MTDLYKNFIDRLEHIYGPFNEKRKSFEKASNSKIARELCYSDSQFSRLINESASEGEYERAIRNVDRIIKEIRLQEEVENRDHEDGDSSRLGISTKSITFFALSGLAAALFIMFITGYWSTDDKLAANSVERDQMLRWIFENSSVSPYLQLNDLPNDCSYACYKYQGQWSLKDTYKIPFFRERNGFHYLATEVNLYTRCKIEESKTGNLLEGYEYQKHEIWYDKRELQIDSFLVDSDKTKIREEYKNLVFQDDTNYVKVAFVHTFFRNEFRIDTSTVARTGMVIGRDVEFVSNEELLDELTTNARVEDIKSEINSISINRLEDFSRPISCKNSSLPDKDFHSIAERDTMSFSCRLTTANAPIQYTKTYVLNDQYIETTCRSDL